MKQSTNQIKRNNHVIPRCLLKRWVTMEEDRYGVNVYEIPKKKYSYSSPSKQRGYSFAIEEYLYVPIVDNERINSLEDWLGALEATLDGFINKMVEGNSQPLYDSIDEYTKLIMALLSFCNRSVYDINLLKKHYAQDPNLIPLLSSNPETEIDILVLQNLVTSVLQFTPEYGHSLITLWVNEEGKFLLCDRPFLHEPIPGISFLPITPYMCLSLDKNQKLKSYKYERISDKLLNKINDTVVERARNWIIALDKKNLEKYAPYCKAFDVKDGFESFKIKHA